MNAPNTTNILPMSGSASISEEEMTRQVCIKNSFAGKETKQEMALEWQRKTSHSHPRRYM